MHIDGPETRECPPEFQARLTEKFGVNQFGDPRYKIVWNQSQFLRRGNVWRDKRGNERVEYRDRYQGDGQPCWMIMKWMSPAHYGSPETFYRNTFDPLTKLYFTGEYPWKGRYEILWNLISKEFINGKLVIEHMPLSHYLIDVILPLTIMSAEMTPEEQAAAEQLEKQEEAKRATEELAETMYQNMPTWINPVSYSKQGCRTSLLDQKMHAIQKQWDRLSRGGKPTFNKGIQQGNVPRLAN